MGVIDLDKRVKKLEQADNAAGAELDQLEAAVTAIENDLTVTTADITDDLETLPEDVEGTAVLQTYGKLVMLTAWAQNAGDNAVSDVKFYEIPESIWPFAPSAVYVSNPVAHVGEDDAIYFAKIESAQEVEVNLYWFVAPEPTPGE